MIEFARYSVEEILPLIGLDKPRINLGKFSVKADSLRLECLKRNQTCVECGRQGTLFILESHVDEPPHLNLYCTTKYKGKFILMTRDHIMPKAHGGKDTIENLQTMCTKCNWRKGANIPEGLQV